MPGYEFLTENFAFDVLIDNSGSLERRRGAVVISGRYLNEATKGEDRSEEILGLWDEILLKYNCDSVILSSTGGWFESAIGKNYKDKMLSSSYSDVLEYIKEPETEFNGMVVFSFILKDDRDDGMHSLFSRF